MDMQEIVVERWAPDAAPVLRAISRALTAARHAGIDIVFVKLEIRLDRQSIGRLNGTMSALAREGILTERSSSGSIVAALSPKARETVVVKRRLSAFVGSDLDLILRAKGID